MAGVLVDGDRSAARCRWVSQLGRRLLLLRLAGACEQDQPHSEAPQAPQMPHRALAATLKTPQHQKLKKVFTTGKSMAEDLIFMKLAWGQLGSMLHDVKLVLGKCQTVQNTLEVCGAGGDLC